MLILLTQEPPKYGLLSEAKDLPHRGYRNMGRRPYESFTERKKLIGKTKKTKEVEIKKCGLAAKRCKEGGCQGTC